MIIHFRFLWILVSLLVCISVGARNKEITTQVEKYLPSENLKEKAFIVLDQNCNNCHSKKKPVYIFTRDNMDAFAPSINRSVFINGNMPKSKKNALSTEDRQILKSGVRKELNH
jgi:uncharacterized membrane protein